VRDAVGVVSLFGAGGTNAAMGPYGPQVRRGLATRLGLVDTEVPWHVARDRVARFGQACSLLACDVRSFCPRGHRPVRTEIAEVREQEGHHRGAPRRCRRRRTPSRRSPSSASVSPCRRTPACCCAHGVGPRAQRGEWQVEWLAVPQVAEYTAAAVRLSADTAATLQVFPDAMRHNMDRDGGLLMSEALMMRLAPVLGRERAHDVVYAAVLHARASGEDVVSVCARELPDDVRVAAAR
jgi:3-carboxy-cis,cis-muconate cycloisomerase